MKNLWSKRRPIDNPYATVSSRGWTYKILKAYQTREKEKINKYARFLCVVSSPMCPEGEWGDTYLSQIPMTPMFSHDLLKREEEESKT